jgi:hypothetical protein
MAKATRLLIKNGTLIAERPARDDHARTLERETTTPRRLIRHPDSYGMRS